MDVLELHHVAIHVADIDRAADFYTKVLGLKEIGRPNFGYPGAWFDLGQGQLHLMCRPQSDRLISNKQLDPNDVHFAIRVKSFSKALQRIKEAGIEHKVSANGPAPWPQIKIADPDGNVIEINAASIE